MKGLSGFLCVVFVFGLLGVANATLYDRGGGLIYDDDLNITWLQDANYAKTSDYVDDGNMTWSDALAWADTLVYGGYDDWRLPTTPGTTSGYPKEGEMGHLYWEEGVNHTFSSFFSNVRAYYYWSGTACVQWPGYAWTFHFDHWEGGTQSNDSLDDSHYAWAVRSGDVPEPRTMLLVGSGLAGIMAVRRRWGPIKI